MAYFDTTTHVVIAVKKTDLNKIQNILLENELDFKNIEADDSHLLRELANELEYESSNEDWDDSGCSF